MNSKQKYILKIKFFDLKKKKKIYILKKKLRFLKNFIIPAKDLFDLVMLLEGFYLFLGLIFMDLKYLATFLFFFFVSDIIMNTVCKIYLNQYFKVWN